MNDGHNPAAAEHDEAFELLKHLGTGGFAQTHLVRVLDEELIREFGAKEVALKIPLSRQKARTLRRELELHSVLHVRLKDLRSKNIVPYLGFDFFRGLPVIAMQYMPDGSLRGVIGKIDHQRPLPVEEAVRMTLEALKGIMVIHEEHIFHRDIKPENILMDGQTPKISDLGISRMLESNELASTTTGTIFYMSPESLSEEGASFPADLWSLGVVLYEMVTGRLPFGNGRTSVGKVIDLIRYSDHTPACEVREEIPRELSRLIDRALKKESNKRFADAREMYDAFSRGRKGADEIEKEMTLIREFMTSTDQSHRAEAKLKQLVLKHPKDPRGYQYLGEFYNRCQCHQEALEIFGKGLKVDRDNALLHWDYALAAQKLGRRAEAIQHLEKALALPLDTSMRRYATTLLNALKGGAR